MYICIHAYIHICLLLLLRGPSALDDPRDRPSNEPDDNSGWSSQVLHDIYVYIYILYTIYYILYTIYYVKQPRSGGRPEGAGEEDAAEADTQTPDLLHHMLEHADTDMSLSMLKQNEYYIYIIIYIYIHTDVKMSKTVNHISRC